MARSDVFRTHLGIALRGQVVLRRDASLDRLAKIFFKKRAAPSATGPCTAALADLARAARLVDADEIQNLPLRDVKTVTDLVVKLHEVVAGCNVRMSLLIP